MDLKTLHPKSIMTTNDFPVYNEQILKIYFKICQKDHPEILPPCPVIHISAGLPLLTENSEFAKKYNISIKKYFEDNPDVEYILCDGSHKTTALMLTHNTIHVMVIENDEDIKEIRKKIDYGEIFSFASPDTIKDILEDKAEHFFEAEFFQTVEDKTRRMVELKVIPQFMIDFYNNK